LSNILRLYYNLKTLFTLITKKTREYASYNPSLINAAKAKLKVFNKYYSYIKANNIYYIAYILNFRVKIG